MRAFHWWHSGNKKRTQNVSEYMLVLALCLVIPFHDSFSTCRLGINCIFGGIVVLRTQMRPIVTDRAVWAPRSVCRLSVRPLFVSDIAVLVLKRDVKLQPTNRQCRSMSTVDQDGTWYGGRPWPRPHCVRWAESYLHTK